MPNQSLANFVLLPELKLTKVNSFGRFDCSYHCNKIPQTEYCPRCSQPSNAAYDHRRVRIKDSPIRGHGAMLVIRKRRLWCGHCQKPFTEPIPGVQKGHRTTRRYGSAVLWACENFVDLKRVKRAFHCSSDFLYRTLYKELERECREQLNYAWPSSIGIDEHGFRRNPITGRTEFASMVVDHTNRKVREIVEGKDQVSMETSLAHIPGRENVKTITIDMCDPFKNFVKSFFPDALIVADKFHVLRLTSPALLKKRKEITGTKADSKARGLLLMSAKKLDYFQRLSIFRFLEKYPDMKELYQWKERLHGFYRIRGYLRAERALTDMTDAMAQSQLKEIKILRKTLRKWREEILNYFKTGLTNARTEGFNNKAKVVKRRGYGYKSFKNYRLRVLHACL